MSFVYKRDGVDFSTWKLFRSAEKILEYFRFSRKTMNPAIAAVVMASKTEQIKTKEDFNQRKLFPAKLYPDVSVTLTTQESYNKTVTFHQALEL